MTEHFTAFTLGKESKICTRCFNGILTEDTRICNNCGFRNPEPKKTAYKVKKIDTEKREITFTWEE